MTMTVASRVESSGPLARVNRPRGQLLTHPSFYQYRQSVVLVALINIGIFVYGMWAGWRLGSQGLSTSVFASMALANFTIAILVRQQYVNNAFYWIATRVPPSWPLWIRWPAAQVYR